MSYEKPTRKKKQIKFKAKFLLGDFLTKFTLCMDSKT